MSPFTLKEQGKLDTFSIFEGHTNITGQYGWSASQDGCNALNTKGTMTAQDCRNLFSAAMDNCKSSGYLERTLINVLLGDTNTVTEKYGSMPLKWNGPNGCVDFNLYAQVRH